MKKLSFLLVLSIMLTAMPARADEGMWLLPLLERLNIKAMQKTGCKMSAEEIYSINHTSLKDAIVQFGRGCTGEIVSDKGLLFTNHHCGYGAIQKLSSVDHDYLKDGYWAMNLNEELPAEGLTVTFVDRFTDVTERLENAVAAAKDEQQKAALFNKEIEKIEKEAVAANPSIEATVTSFYNNNIYYLITTKTFKDIRFVGAPPSSIGKFGADTDNWMWPRHTGDFSVFRVYADKDNNPAEYSQDNVPYTPKRSLKISLKGIQKDDYTMIMGFPGRTQRFMTSEEAIETQNINNAVSIFARGEKQDIWMKDMQADQKVRIQYSSKYAHSSNGWKKWIGMNETFGKLDVVARRKAEEVEFMEWVNADPARVEKYGKALEKINGTVKERAALQYVANYINETLGSIELFNAARKGDKLNAAEFYKDYSVATDRKLAVRMLEIYQEKVDAQYHPELYKEIGEKFNGSIGAYVDHVFAASVFASREKLEKALADRQDLQQDPAFLAARSIAETGARIMPELQKGRKTYLEGKKEYLAGILEKEGDNASYPDANLTLRLTYGKVLPYSPKDAIYYDFQTTMDGIMQKEDPDNWEFVVPARLKELYSRKDFGPYALPNGKMPVAFLTNNDITGGNSGSPVMNAKGELLGLAFDGNWESMSGDVIFEPNLQRCINVDIRYVLFIIDKFGGAGYLLDEMDIVK